MTDSKLSPAHQLYAMLQTDPANTSLLQECVRVALSEGRRELALQALDVARAGELQEPLHAYVGAQLLLHDKAWDQAATAFSRLLAEHGAAMRAPDVASGLHGQGYAEFRAGDFEKARETLLRAIETGAAPPGTLAWLLRSVHRTGGPTEACATWESSSPQDRDAESAGVASLAYFDTSRHEQAASLASLCLAERPDCVEALVVQAAEDLLHGTSDSALKLLEHALRMNGTDGRVWSTLATARMATGDLDGALHAYDTATQTMSQHIGTWSGKAWIHIIQRDFSAARACLARAMAIDDRFGETHGAFAVISAMEGQREEALRHLITARRLDPAGFAWRYADALLAGDAKDAESIERLARQLLSSSGVLQLRTPPTVH